jgi:phytol kinase
MADKVDNTPGSPVAAAGKAAADLEAQDWETEAKQKQLRTVMSADMKNARSRGDSSSPAAEWLRAKQIYIFWVSLVVMIGWLAIMLKLTIGKEREDQEWFWWGLILKNAILLVIQLVMGYGVYLYNWHTGYTRKCVHVGFFLLPTLLDVLLPKPEEDAWLFGLWNVHIIMWMLIMIVKPVRKHSKFIQILYAAVDRPEDKGYTQLYTLMQVPLSIVIIAGFQVLFNEWLDKEAWTICPIIAVTFGDGLAEPVAVYWSRNKVCGGTHTYQTRGMCTTRKFTRSLEGSSVVFIWTAIAIAMIHNELSTAEAVFLYALLPISMAVLEAFAPHSMDNPFLLGWGFLCMVGAHYVGEAFD